MILWSFTGEVLKYFGNDEEISNNAGYFAFVLMFAIPARVCFRNLASYF